MQSKLSCLDVLCWIWWRFSRRAVEYYCHGGVSWLFNPWIDTMLCMDISSRSSRVSRKHSGGLLESSFGSLFWKYIQIPQQPAKRVELHSSTGSASIGTDRMVTDDENTLSVSVSGSCHVLTCKLRYKHRMCLWHFKAEKSLFF